MRDEDLVLIPRRVIGAACGALGRSDKKDCAALVDLRSYAFHPASPPHATPAAPAGGFVVDGWPFVESPGDFTERLRDAMNIFPLLGAVRYVLIEDPPTIITTPAAQPSAKDGELRHDFSDDNGRRCIVCGASDWETGGVCPGAKDGVRGGDPLADLLDCEKAIREASAMPSQTVARVKAWDDCATYCLSFVSDHLPEIKSALEAAIGREVTK